MQTSSNEAEQIALLRWMNGDKTAAACLQILGEISQVADDLVDEESSSERMTALLYLIFEKLEPNQFYQQNRTRLTSVVTMFLLQWDLANGLAKISTKNSRHYSYVLRCAYEQIITYAALLTGGFNHARKVAIEVHHFYHSGPNAETFEEWKP